jgi:mono/diheme cytochrome c family protein
MSSIEAAKSLSRRSVKRHFALLLVVFAACGIIGCRRDMQDQPKYEVYERGNELSDDKQTQRPLPEGTVPRGYLRDDDHLYTGKIPGGGGAGGGGQTVASSNGVNQPNAQVANRVDGAAAGDLVPSPGAAAAQFDADLATTFPFPVTRAVLDRGEERFRVFCAMCHGLAGDGDGMVVRRGFKKPTSYHDDRLRGAPAGHFFDVITNGFGSMPNYAAQITPRDRWAITAYIRALQLSRGASIEDVPEELRQSVMGNVSGGAQQHGSGAQHGQSEGGSGH